MMRKFFPASTTAVAMVAVFTFASPEAVAKPTHWCFKTGDGKKFLSIDPKDGRLNAKATACSGNAIFTLDRPDFDKNLAPTLFKRVVIRAANSGYVEQRTSYFYATAKQIVAGKPSFEFSVRQSDSTKPLAANMRVNIYNYGGLLLAASTSNGVVQLMRKPGYYQSGVTPQKFLPAFQFTLISAPAPKASPKAPTKTVKRWQPFGGEYAAPSINKDGNVVTVTGLIKGGTANHLWTVPKALAPRQRLVFNLNHHGTSNRVDVFPDGKVIWVAGGRKHGWRSLSGIKYSLKPTGKLRLASGWRPFGGEYAPPAYTRQGNLVTVSGLIKSGKYGHLATLPKNMAPPRRLIFNLNNHVRPVRIDVLADGKIVWVAGGREHKWLSFSGIAFNVSPQAKAKLVNGWKPYGKEYATATAARQGNLVTLSGLIKGGKYGHMMTLPKPFVPAKRLVFSINNHQNQARVDVLPNGKVLWIAGSKTYGWVSLAGIAYKTNQAAPKPANSKVVALKKKIAATRKSLARMEAELKKMTGK